MMTETENEKLTRHLGKQLRAIVAVADELEETGVLKQSKDEAVEMKDEAVKAAGVAVRERDKALEELTRVAEKLRVARREVVAVVSKAETQAKAIVDAAAVRTGGMLSVARKKVDEMTRRMGVFEQEHAGNL